MSNADTLKAGDGVRREDWLVRPPTSPTTSAGRTRKRRSYRTAVSPRERTRSSSFSPRSLTIVIVHDDARRVIESGDTVVVLSHSEATGKDTGKDVKLPWVHVWRFSDGKVTEVQALTDTALAADALGKS